MKKKSSPKQVREKAVLLGLIDLYIKDGAPIGSNTLKESGFHDLSSATIRNYFAKLEEGGYLKQLHSSGGRVPTSKGLKFYAEHHHHAEDLPDVDKLFLSSHLAPQEQQEIVLTLQKGVETLAELSETAVLITAPRFDQDQIQTIKLVDIDESRLLAAIVTRFGLIHTETIFVNQRIPQLQLRRLESYFQARLGQLPLPPLSEDDEKLGHFIYNELLLRHIVNYSTFTESDIYKTGFSRLLSYPELHEATALAGSLSLFENPSLISQLLAPTTLSTDLIYYIGEEDLSDYIPSPACSLIACSYLIHGKIAGAVSLLGPTRLDYPRLFALLRAFTHYLSKTLTKTTDHFKITFRSPKTNSVDLQRERQALLGVAEDYLYEDERYPHE